MATSLAEIRAKLQAQGSRGPGGSGGGDNQIFPHWNSPDMATTRLRFLPDGDPANPFFWIERALINLKFAGTLDSSDKKPVTVQVPCVEMWGDTCPILAQVRPWYKDESLKETANQYWKKRSYFFQGFVRDNPLKEDPVPTSPIRRFIISPQIFSLIKASLLDPEMENVPTDYLNGLDFSILKTTKGEYADYNTSKWSRKESALTAEEQAAIEQYGLFDLKTFLPRKPSAADLEMMVEMFEASVDGKPYDEARWGAHFRPRGQFVAAEASSSAAPQAAQAPQEAQAPQAAQSVVIEENYTTAPAGLLTPVQTPVAGSTNRAEDILAQIRSRQKAAV